MNLGNFIIGTGKWIGPKIIKSGKKIIIKEGAKKTDKNVERVIEEDGNIFNIESLNKGEQEFLEEFGKMSPKEQDQYLKEIRAEQERVRLEKEYQDKLPPDLDVPSEDNNKPYPELFDEDIKSKKEDVFKEIEKFNNSKEDVLYKDNDNITQQEIDDALVYGNYENEDRGLKNEINDKASSWYDNIFGGDSAAKDETGKTMDIMPQKEPSTEPSELSTSDGMSIMDGFKGIASSVANFGVEALQGALNAMPSNRPQLKTDGVVGPKTVSRTKEALARQGLATTQRNIGATSFSQMMQQNKGKPVDTSKLNGIVQKIDPQNGATALQKGINTIGQAIGGYDKIKEDGIVGPKTTEAFNKIKDGNEDELKTVFAPQQEPKNDPYQTTEMERYFSAQIR